MKALVVGANGLLGQNLLRAAPRGWELFGCGIEEAPLAPGLPADRWTRVDIADLGETERVVRAADADVVFNAAAMTAVDACESEPERCARVNRDAVRAMARAAKRLVHLSTDYVFDGRNGPYSEEDAPNPLGVYGRVKLESERAVLSASPDHLVVRTMLLYGTGRGLRPSFVDWVRTNLEAGRRIPVVGDQVGNPTLASDLAVSLWALVSAGKSGLWHCSGTERCSRLEWARRVAARTGLDASLIDEVRTEDLRQPAKRPPESGFRLDRISAVAGVRLRSLDEQMDAYFEEKKNVRD